MADDIKIRVGVQNNVKAGMDAAVRDVQRGARQANQGSSLKQLGGGIKTGQGGGVADMLGSGGLSGIAKAGLAIGAAAMALKAWVMSAKSYAESVSDISDNTGASVNAIQKLIYGAKGFGVEAQQLEVALGKIGSAQSEAFTNPAIIEGLKRLNIGVAEFVNMSPDEAYMRLGKALKETGDKAALLDIVGKSGMRQIGFMKSLASGISEVGLASETNVKAVDSFFDRIGQGMQRLKAAGVDKLGQLIRGDFAGFMGAGIPEQETPVKDQIEAQNEKFKKEKESKYKAGLVEENKAAEERNRGREVAARQRELDVKNFEAQRDAHKVKQGIVGRIMGRQDLDPQAAIDRKMKAAIDDDFRKGEKNAEREVTRQDNRLKRLQKMAQDPNRRKYSPQLQRIFDATEKAENLAMAQGNIDARKAEAEQAQIDMAKDMAAMKANTEELKNLKGLLTLK